MLADSPLSIAVRRRGFPPGSPPPARAATVTSRMILVKILPRLASVAFLRPSIDGPRPMGNFRTVAVEGAGFYPLALPSSLSSVMDKPAVGEEMRHLAGGAGGQQQAGMAG